MEVIRGKEVRVSKEWKGVKYMVMEEDLTLGGRHAVQYTGDVS